MGEPGHHEQRSKRRGDERGEDAMCRAEPCGAGDDGEQRAGRGRERRQAEPGPWGDAGQGSSPASRRRRSRSGRGLDT
jgi:hypothetical protein